MKMDQRKHGDEKRKKWKRIYERTEIIRGGHENGSEIMINESMETKRERNGNGFMKGRRL